MRLIVLACAALLAGCAHPVDADRNVAAADVPADAQEAAVSRHVDGDTIWVRVDEPGGPLPPGVEHKIRLLEIDAPESTNAHECYGDQAAEFAAAELPLGSTVHLVADREDTDQYGRFLRYVWTADGEFFNETAVREGYARAVLYEPNDAYIDVLRAAELQARAEGAGLWSACPVGQS